MLMFGKLELEQGTSYGSQVWQLDQGTTVKVKYCHDLIVASLTFDWKNTVWNNTVRKNTVTKKTAFVGQVMSPHHSDQRSEKSQVSMPIGSLIESITKKHSLVTLAIIYDHKIVETTRSAQKWSKLCSFFGLEIRGQ